MEKTHPFLIIFEWFGWHLHFHPTAPNSTCTRTDSAPKRAKASNSWQGEFISWWATGGSIWGIAYSIRKSWEGWRLLRGIKAQVLFFCVSCHFVCFSRPQAIEPSKLVTYSLRRAANVCGRVNHPTDSAIVFIRVHYLGANKKLQKSASFNDFLEMIFTGFLLKYIPWLSPGWPDCRPSPCQCPSCHS